MEVALRHRALKKRGASRAEILREFSRIEGVYVPSLYDVEEHEIRDEQLAAGMRGYTTVTPVDAEVPAQVTKRIIRDFDALPALPRQIVPYCELVHDRLAIEILRGCNRGCRFCQAGMIYRPVRERKADTVIAAVMDGLASTGYDEVSLDFAFLDGPLDYRAHAQAIEPELLADGQEREPTEPACRCARRRACATRGGREEG